ncbi:MAG: hypothetical protein PHQ95_04325 [Candidatus Gracilibacteria bacterium]|nr:hypothetical protein [Candidatus Gracilibacteria bacterium]
MTVHHINLHYLSDFDYEGRDALADAYNEALKCIGKDGLSFFDEWADEMYKDGVDYEENETYGKTFEIRGYQELGDNNYYSVRINFHSIPKEDIDRFQEKFLSELRKKSQVVYKFEDSRFLEVRKQFFEDIYRVETSLREAMSFIFLTTYYDFGDFLRDLKVGDVTTKNNITQDDLRNSFENEFFYISFKDYRNLLELKHIKELKEGNVEALITDSASFEDWRKRIEERGIRDEPYVAFIKSIKMDLEFLEQFRNAVMHNRHFDMKLKQGYEKARDSILAKARDFLGKHVHLDGNWYGLIPGKEYQCTWDMEHFKKGKKYPLARIVHGDYMFIGDDGEEHWFRDKEFMEFFRY